MERSAIYVFSAPTEFEVVTYDLQTSDAEEVLGPWLDFLATTAEHLPNPPEVDAVARNLIGA